MIFNLLLTILILDAIVLVAAILMQSGKGGGMAANFGGQSSSSDQFIGVRQAGNLLTKMSWWCGGIFMGLSFILQLMSTNARAPRSILEKTLAAPTAAPITAPPTSSGAIPLEPQAQQALPGTTPQVAPVTPADSSKR